MKKGVEAGRRQRVGTDEDAVFGDEFQAVRQSLQAGGRFTGAAVPDEQQRAATTAEAGGVQRYQGTGAREQREHREFDEL